MMNSANKGYHRRGQFERIMEWREWDKAAKKAGDGEGSIEDDVTVDNRPKLSKAEKRRRHLEAEAHSQRYQQQQHEKIMTSSFLHIFGAAERSSKRQVNQVRVVLKTRKSLQGLLDATDNDLVLAQHHHVNEGDFESPGMLFTEPGKQSKDRSIDLKPGWKILKESAAQVLTKSKLEDTKKFPLTLTVGRGCKDCGAALAMSWDERCTKCHTKMVNLTERSAVKGSGVIVERGVWQATAKFQPPMFEISLTCRADGTDFLKTLKSVVDDNLVLTGDFVEFNSISTQCNRGNWTTWEKSPEKLFTCGCKITDALWCSAKRSGLQGLEALEELDHVSFTQTYCSDHQKAGVRCRQCNTEARLMHHSTIELVKIVIDGKTHRIVLPGMDEPYTCKCGSTEFRRTCDCGATLEPEQEWCRKCKAKWEDRFHSKYCKNCVGVVRLRVSAPDTYVERKGQLQRLDISGLMGRACLLGLQDHVQGSNKLEVIKHIIKAERIIE
jgi:hypothetical protein